MKRFLLGISILFCAAGLTFADNAKASSGVTTITFWSWLPTTLQWDGMVAAFEKANPGIKVNYTRTEQSDYFSKLQVALASGTGPDVFGLTTGGMVDQYAPFCVPMNTLADKYSPNWRKIISSTAINQSTSAKGVLVGMPLLVAGMDYMLYNQTLMNKCGVAKVPENYAEMLAAAKKIQAAGFVPVAIGAADDWQNVDWFVNASNQFEPGAVYEAQKGKRSFTDKCFVETAKVWAKLFKDGIFETGALGVTTYPDARDQYFFDRKAVFFVTGSWHVGPTSTSNPEIVGTKIKANNDVIGMTKFPQVGPNEFRATTGVDVLMSVSKDSKKQEAAMKFVNFMSMGEGQQQWVNWLQGSPVANNITYQGKIDGKLQKQSIDDINAWNSNAIGDRKLKYPKLEKAIVIAMQNIAAGSDPTKELARVEAVSKAIKR